MNSLGISVREFVYRKPGRNVERFLHLGSRQGKVVCDADQLDAEENDAFTTSAYHSWR